MRAVARQVKARLRRLRLVLIRRVRGLRGLNDELLHSRPAEDALRAGGAQVGNAGVLHGPLVIHNAEGSYANLRIGDRVHLGREVLLDLTAPLTIEDEATISMRAVVLTHSDVGDRPLQHAYPSKAEKTRIGAGAYVGANVTILAGCHIGRKAVVGAGAVVTRPVPDGARVAGIPAEPLEGTSH